MTTSQMLQNACICPPVAGQSSMKAGVFSQAGQYVEESIVWRGTKAMLQAPGSPQNPQNSLPGCHLYAGYLSNHFGHFQCESLARLWPLGNAENQIESIIFIPKRGESGAEILAFHHDFFQLLGIDIPIVVITEPTVVEKLIVPSQGFGIDDLSQGKSEFRAYMKQAFATSIAPEGAEKLYISRTGLGPRKGTMLGEKFLAEYLEKEGYEIMQPERYTLAEQVARYKAARKIIALEGSAIHLLGFCGDRAQEVAIISRRSSIPEPNSFTRQLSSFCEIKPVHIQGIAIEWVVESKGVPNSKSMVEPDFERIQCQLREAGFIKGARPWPALRQRFIERSLLRSANFLGCKFVPFDPSLQSNS